MMRSTRILAALLALLVLWGCKPSEANYRAAYEKAMAAREQGVDGDSTIYTKIRREMQQGSMIVGEDTVRIATQFVAVTPDGGGINESLKAYNVVVGQFKQEFNAKSLRERLVDNGYPGAFVVQTREPYYYVVAGSFRTPEEAAQLFKKTLSDQMLRMKDPLPFVLQPSQIRR